MFHQTGLTEEFVTAVTSAVAADLLSLTDRYSYEFSGHTVAAVSELLKFF